MKKTISILAVLLLLCGCLVLNACSSAASATKPAGSNPPASGNSPADASPSVSATPSTPAPTPTTPDPTPTIPDENRLLPLLEAFRKNASLTVIHFRYLATERAGFVTGEESIAKETASSMDSKSDRSGEKPLLETHMVESHTENGNKEDSTMDLFSNGEFIWMRSDEDETYAKVEIDLLGEDFTSGFDGSDVFEEDGLPENDDLLAITETENADGGKTYLLTFTGEYAEEQVRGYLVDALASAGIIDESMQDITIDLTIEEASCTMRFTVDAEGYCTAITESFFGKTQYATEGNEVAASVENEFTLEVVDPGTPVTIVFPEV